MILWQDCFAKLPQRLLSAQVEFKAATGSEWLPAGGAPAKKQDKKKEKKEAPKVEE